MVLPGDVLNAAVPSKPLPPQAQKVDTLPL
jgi:hypothetical protein